ncbi:MAG: branched-chain amino acid ABC transporter substrate-binding protein [Desulfovibrionaceae bacterium]|nr:branched-chain amino acid ABC transporter substrate-binding protein [Desulfovibrionaceae bacterium]
MGFKFLKVLAVAGLVLGLSLSQAMAKDTFIIGVPGAHSGDNASYGVTSLKTAQLVAKLWNQKGGVLGKEIVVQAEDDQCKPELATNAASKLLSSEADVVMGHTCSGATKAALPMYTSANKVIISPSATSPQLTQSGNNPTFFRSIASDDMQAKVTIDQVKKLGITKVAILHDKAEYGRGYAEHCQSFAEKEGIEVALFEGITAGAVDYSAVIQKVRSSGAEAVIFGGYQPEASKLVTQMRKKKIDIPFLSDDGVKNMHFLRLAGKFSEGVYAVGPKDISKNPMYQEARDQYRAEYNEDPGAYFDQAYAATVALLNAVEKSGSADTEKIMQVLRTEYVETPLGKIRFNEFGEAEGVGFDMYQVVNGEFVEAK